MTFFTVTLVFSLLLGTVLADKNGDCLKGLQRCYDYNIYAIDRNLEGDMDTLADACMLYSNALKCMDTLPCEKTSSYTKKHKFLKNELYKDVAGACMPDGQIDGCIMKLIKCEGAFQKADEDLKSKDAKAGCLEVATFDKCMKDAKSVCPDRAIADIFTEWQPLNKDAYKAGCDVDCNTALEECTFELRVSDSNDKEEVCQALHSSKKCLENTQKDIGCSSKDSQKYLKKAIAQKTSKYVSHCDGVPPSVQISLLLILSAIATSVFSRRFSE